jgi:hypothetical protein
MPIVMKKRASKTEANRPVTTLRFASDDEREQFRRAAVTEGFSTTTAWMMYHLRRQAKQTLGIERA